MIKPRQSPLRIYLKRIGMHFFRILRRKKSKDSGYDYALGEQVELPEELLESVTRMAAGIDQR
jgi:hypothetical protein